MMSQLIINRMAGTSINVKSVNSDFMDENIETEESVLIHMPAS